MLFVKCSNYFSSTYVFNFLDRGSSWGLFNLNGSKLMQAYTKFLVETLFSALFHRLDRKYRDLVCRFKKFWQNFTRRLLTFLATTNPLPCLFHAFFFKSLTLSWVIKIEYSGKSLICYKSRLLFTDFFRKKTC